MTESTKKKKDKESKPKKRAKHNSRFEVDKFDPTRIPEYQKAGEGWIQFVEENVRFKVIDGKSGVTKWLYPTEISDEKHPETGRSWRDMWNSQKEEVRPALKMIKGKFKYKVIVLCWPRGEGKSFIVVLIQLWKFFCFPRQLIVFGALSKDQTKFVHYDISIDLIYNSPKLVNIIGKANVQAGKLILRNSKGEVTSSIRPISSFSGIVSNITGYTFSEMFDMRDPKFFVQLDGSTRYIINALGTIDSTVSAKDHILYQLYRGYRDGSDKLIYFSYRSAPKGDTSEYWNPEATEAELRSRQSRYPAVEFDRYFKNIWEAESGRLFTRAMVNNIFTMGWLNEDKTFHKDDGTALEIHNKIQKIVIELDAKNANKNKTAKRRRRSTRIKDKTQAEKKIQELKSSLVPVKNFYKISDHTIPTMATNEMLTELGEMYDTNWSIHVGLDRSDPLSDEPQARTIVTCIAKGLEGSRSDTNIVYEDRDIPEYIYFLLHLAHIEDASMEGIKREVKACHAEYDGVDTFCSERWGAWDFATWCSQLDIEFEAIFPSFPMQKKIFNALFLTIRNCTFKSPNIYVPGKEDPNILSEELVNFNYNPVKKFYGSPTKKDKGGLQDDSVFSLGLGIYGGRDYGIDDFRERISNTMFGLYVPGSRKIGTYM